MTVVIILFYVFSLIALLVGTAAIFMALIDVFPASWLYYHYYIRKPLNWTILATLLVCTVLIWSDEERFPLWATPPLAITVLAIVLTYRMHQESAFQAVDFPEIADDIDKLPISDERQLAIIDHCGVSKAYPLDYVIHHHIVNDRFGDRMVALTYCAMCRTVIPFDVTDIGPLFVGSFKRANMIVADRKTKTFFQQATFNSIIGPLHPHTLTMLPFQILSWEDVKGLKPVPAVVNVTVNDFREFQLPIPGIWRRIMASEATPGLPSEKRDKTFPARTRVIGILDKSITREIVFLKKEVLASKFVNDVENAFVLIASGDAVNGFKSKLDGETLQLQPGDEFLVDRITGTKWDLRGKFVSGKINRDLNPLALSDEYWFSWKQFHPTAAVVRLAG